MKYKAKASYKDLDNSKNFISLLSTSTHLTLLAGLAIEYNGDIPEDLMKHLTELKSKKGEK
tara:strand:+ start:176 stop:358 length:183 start_codon:yes stop_codon:yes gene_type:complete